jgi:flagellar biogenesis protein FliO
MNLGRNERDESAKFAAGGLTGWLVNRVLGRFLGGKRQGPRLALVERIALAPRHSLALVEAEGRRILVATSADGAPAFFALDERMRPSRLHEATPSRNAARVSW